MFDKLLIGQIEIGDVLLINIKKEVFYDVNKIIWECDRNIVLDQELVFQILKFRCKEINSIKDLCVNMKELVFFC